MTWHESWPDLVRELRAGRGQPALVAGSPESATLQDAIGSCVVDVISVGQSVLAAATPDAVLGNIQPRGESVLLIEIEALLEPQMNVDVVAFLRQMAQRCALVAVWPGEIENGRLSYSRPGRTDYINQSARDLIVLRPVRTSFPDEVPYTVERYPA